MMEDLTKTDLPERTVKKQQKRVLHFSDGTATEYSSGEEDGPDDLSMQNVRQVVIDEASLGWIEWLRYKSGNISTATIDVCDYLGDHLANFFGITTPKYQFEINHYNTMKNMENESSDVEMGTTLAANEK